MTRPEPPRSPGRFKNAGYTTLSDGKIFHHPEDTRKRSWSEAAWTPGRSTDSHDPETTRHLTKTKQRGRMYEAPDVLATTLAAEAAKADAAGA